MAIRRKIRAATKTNEIKQGFALLFREILAPATAAAATAAAGAATTAAVARPWSSVGAGAGAEEQ